MRIVPWKMEKGSSRSKVQSFLLYEQRKFEGRLAGSRRGVLAKGLPGGKASQAEGTVNARDSAGGRTCAPNRREAGMAGASAHKWVGKADYVGAFQDPGDTWALPPEGGGGYSRVLRSGGAWSSHFSTGSL